MGRKMGQEAKPGQVPCLEGDLGVGKTVFTRGLAGPGNRELGGRSPPLYH